MSSGLVLEYFSGCRGWNLICYFFPPLLGRNVILSVGYAHGSSCTQSGLNVNVSRDVLKNVLFCLLHFISCPLPFSSLLLGICDSFSSPHLSILTLNLLVFALSWLLLPPTPSLLLSLPSIIFHLLSPDSVPYCSLCSLVCYLLPPFSPFIQPLSLLFCNLTILYPSVSFFLASPP